MIKLCFYHIQDLRISVTAGVNTKTTEAVDELFTVQSIAICSFIMPLQYSTVLRIGGNGFSVFQPARTYIVVKIMKCVIHHFLFVISGNLIAVRADQRNNLIEIFNNLFLLCHNKFLLFGKNKDVSAEISSSFQGVKYE